MFLGLVWFLCYLMHYAITFFSGIFMDYLREYGFY